MSRSVSDRARLRASGTTLIPDGSAFEVLDWASRSGYAKRKASAELNKVEPPTIWNSYGRDQSISDVRGATAHVSRPTDSYTYPKEVVHNTSENYLDRIPSYETTGFPAAADPHTGTSGLFDVWHEPPSVYSLYSTMDRHPGSVSRVLGVAALESHARYGQYPVPSTDLSKHSAPLVDKVKSSGALGQSAKADKPSSVTNDVSWRVGEGAVDSTHFRATYAGVPINGLKVLQGQQFFRDVTGQTPKAAPAKQKTLF